MDRAATLRLDFEALGFATVFCDLPLLLVLPETVRFEVELDFLLLTVVVRRSVRLLSFGMFA